MANDVATQLKDYVAGAQKSAEVVVDQLKRGKVEFKELLFLNTAYLGGFGLVALLLPSLATTAYGGDSAPYYAADWARGAAVGGVALALLSALVSQRQWVAEERNTKDVLLVFVAYYALAAFVNLVTAMYGALSVICFLNAVADVFLAYLHLPYAGLMPPKAA
jgi:hypothetical protein